MCYAPSLLALRVGVFVHQLAAAAPPSECAPECDAPTAPAPLVCQDGFFLDSKTGKCEACAVPNCSVCDEAGAGCAWCEDGFELRKGKKGAPAKCVAVKTPAATR